MPDPRDRPVWALILSFMLVFLGGAVLGLTLAERLAPGSFLGAFIGLFTLPLTFGIGMQVWFGWALLSVLPLLVRRLRGLPVEPLPYASIPGSFVFAPVGAGFGTAAGIATALLPSTDSRFLAFVAWTAAGTLYGIICWRLAVAGLLFPPEE